MSEMSYAKACRIVDERSDRRCERCGHPVQVGGSHHHRLLRSRGGGNSPQNIVFLCGSGTTGCHGWAHANPASATEQGWMLPSKTDPARAPIRRSRYGDYAYLGEDGQVYDVQPTDCIRTDRAVRLAATRWPATADTEGSAR